VESVLRKEKRVYGGNDLWKRSVLKMGVKVRVRYTREHRQRYVFLSAAAVAAAAKVLFWGVTN